MSRIRIKNFGPIKDGCQETGGWIEIGKVTVFIGNQGSGKSTVAKLISTFLWLEKALTRDDAPPKEFTQRNRFKKRLLRYHRLENYFPKQSLEHSLIEYEGDSYHIKYEQGELSIKPKTNHSYSLPQIVYVPAERNFIAYVKTPKELRLSSESLKEFISEFDEAKTSIKGSIPLPIDGSDIEYDRLNDTLSIKGVDYRIKLSEASSGFQSFAPLYIVSHRLAHVVSETPDEKQPSMSSEEMLRFQKFVQEIYNNKDLTEEGRRAAISALAKRIRKTAFINIVEEPEQNLFPSSQWKMLGALLKLNNMSPDNKLIATTHSPYVIGYLNLVLQSAILRGKINTTEGKGHLKNKLDAIITEDISCHPESVFIYQLDDKKGQITKLTDYEGIPSDDNYLNQGLRNGNDLFDKLLEIEDELA